MTESSVWLPKGEQGDPGPQGPVGPQGPAGPQGGPGPDAAAFAAFVDSLENPVGINNGAGNVARTSTLVESVAQLSLVNATLDQIATTKSWHSDLLKGGMEFVYSGTTAKSSHNGGTIISDTVPYTTRDEFLAGTGETVPGGFGCWVARTAGVNVTADNFGAIGDGTTTDVSAINKAIASVRTVKLEDNTTYAINDSLNIPDNTLLWGRKTAKLQHIVPWANNNERRMVTNADKVNGNISPMVWGFTIEGIPTGGSEWDHGIHFGGTTRALIRDVTISKCQGDGICLGSFVGNIPLIANGTWVEDVSIDDVRRQGIAMTCAEGSRIVNPYITNLTNAITGAGVAIDFEPNNNADTVRDNHVIGGYCKNVKAGVILSSVANMPEAQVSNNKVRDFTIDTTTGLGVQVSFWNTEIRGCFFKNIAQEAIKLISSAGVQGCDISDNVIKSASTSAAQGFDAIVLTTAVAHCKVIGNIIQATGVNNTINDSASSGQNVIVDNLTRPSNRPMSLHASDTVGHNKVNSSVELTLHEGFALTGDLNFRTNNMLVNGGRLIFVTAAPSGATGSDNDLAMNVNATTGQPVFWKKVSGTWRQASPNIS